MEWSREWQKETALTLSPDTVYEKKYFDQGGVARITMSRTTPKGLNLITPVGIRELIYCMRDARNDASIGAVILRGAGDKSFNAGGDVGGEKEDSQQVFEDEPSVHAHMRLLGKPIIAVVKGSYTGRRKCRIRSGRSQGRKPRRRQNSSLFGPRRRSEKGTGTVDALPQV
jgi:1,4-dihydroxy-2-naphthoyl-CoA synthase